MNVPNLGDTTPPQKMVLPPVIHLRDFQFRLVDERRTGEGTEIRLDIMHPMFPLIIVLPWDRLVFADFAMQCKAMLVNEETEDDNSGN